MAPTQDGIIQPVIRNSTSRIMNERFKKYRTRRHLAAFIYITTSLAYLFWRATILNHNSMALSIIYYIAECFGFLLGFTIITSSNSYSHHEPKPVLKNRSVDILIPVYTEPLELIRLTAMAAKNIEYPHNTFILDDSRREDIQKIAEELGVNYLSRPRNTHAKAGNLNFGLKHSKAEFVMVFDADHIPLPHALDIMLGFFADEKVALVQTPQEYYNTNAFQYINSRDGVLGHEQSFYYNISQACRDNVNGATCVGTGVVYRRSALDKIGGIPVETVTEDTHTTLKLHKAGYKSIYINEPIAYGEAAPDLREYYKTRQRWGHGNLHTLVHENILFCKGLTLKQRWSYISSGLIYLEGWHQLLLFIVPVASLAFGLQPF